MGGKAGDINSNRSDPRTCRSEIMKNWHHDSSRFIEYINWHPSYYIFFNISVYYLWESLGTVVLKRHHVVCEPPQDVFQLAEGEPLKTFSARWIKMNCSCAKPGKSNTASVKWEGIHPSSQTHLASQGADLHRPSISDVWPLKNQETPWNVLKSFRSIMLIQDQ